MLHLGKHITRGHLIGLAIPLRDAHPLTKLVEGVLVSYERERPQAAGNAVGTNVEFDPEGPFHERSPSRSLLTAACGLPGKTCS